MPRSVFLGRVQLPGEPLFLAEDTDAAMALSLEERDACPACGFPKAFCRDPKNQFAFDVHEERCWATYRMAQHKRSDKWDAKHEDTKQATQLSPVFREGHEPDLSAGLNINDEDGGAGG